MIVKFFTAEKHKGKASPRRMKNYLTRDAQSNKEGIKVLRGDPERTCKIAEQLSFSKNYTAGCLSFLESDLTDRQKELIMDSFERMVFAGMDREQYDISWIEHRDKGRLELNFFSPEVDLRSGKRFQMYYHKRDVQMFNAWRNVVNTHFGLADPTDPSRRQATTFKRGQSQKAVDIKTECERLAVAWYADGSVTNRNELVNRLIDEVGFDGVAKTAKGKDKFGKDYVTFIKTDEGKEQRFRLKGALFEEVAPVSSYTNTPTPNHTINLEAEKDIYRKMVHARMERHAKNYSNASKTAFNDLTSITLTTPLKRTQKATNNDFKHTTTNSTTTENDRRVAEIARRNATITTNHHRIAESAHAITREGAEINQRERRFIDDKQRFDERNQRTATQNGAFEREQQEIDRLCERTTYSTHDFSRRAGEFEHELQTKIERHCQATRRHYEDTSNKVNAIGNRINNIRNRRAKELEQKQLLIRQRKEQKAEQARKIKRSPYLTPTELQHTINYVQQFFDKAEEEKGLATAIQLAEQNLNGFNNPELLQLKTSNPTAYLDNLVRMVADEQVYKQVLNKTGVSDLAKKEESLRVKEIPVHEWTSEYQRQRKEHQYFNVLYIVAKGKIDRQHGKPVDETLLKNRLRDFAILHSGMVDKYQREFNNGNQESGEKLRMAGIFVDILNDSHDPAFSELASTIIKANAPSNSFGFGR